MRNVIASLVCVVSLQASVITGSFSCSVSGGESVSASPSPCMVFASGSYASASFNGGVTSAGGRSSIDMFPQALAYIADMSVTTTASAQISVTASFATAGPPRPGYLAITDTCSSPPGSPYSCDGMQINGAYVQATGTLFVPITLGAPVLFAKDTGAYQSLSRFLDRTVYSNVGTVTLSAFEANRTTPVALSELSDAATPEPATVWLILIGLTGLFLVKNTNPLKFAPLLLCAMRSRRL